MKAFPVNQKLDIDATAKELIRVLNAYEGGSPQFSSQGQAMSGYDALAAFVEIAERVREELQIKAETK